MGQRTLTERIVDLLEVSSKPLSAADIRRRLHGDISHSDVTCRLAQLKKRGKVLVVQVASQAITGPRLINAYEIAAPVSSSLTSYGYCENPQKTPDFVRGVAPGALIHKKAA